MKVLKISLATLSLLTFLFYSCQDDYELYEPPTPGNPDVLEAEVVPEASESFEDLFEQLQSDTLVLEIPLDSLDSITTGNGLTIKFPSGDCVGGLPSNSDEIITLKILELYKRSEFVFNNVSNDDRENHLITAGAFHLEIFDSSGQQLYIYPNSGVEAVIEKQTDIDGYENTALGFLGSKELVENENFVAWMEDSSISTLYDSGLETFTLTNIVDGWNSCNSIYDGDLVDFKVEITNATDVSALKVYYISDVYSTVAQFSFIDNGMFVTLPDSCPVGEEGHLLAISLENDELRYQVLPITVADGEVYQMAVATGTVPELKLAVEALD